MNGGGALTPLQQRLARLRNWEAANVLVFPACLVSAWRSAGDPIAWLPRLAPLLLVSFVLVQGALYWHWKLRSVRRRVPLPASFCATFRHFYRVNIAGLLLTAAPLLLAKARGQEISAIDQFWAVTLWVLALLGGVGLGAFPAEIAT